MEPPMKTQSEQAQKKYDENLDRLWEVIQKASPKRKEEIINSLDAKTVTALRTRKNPYKKPVFKGNKERYLSFHVINLREKYLKRFAMTSLIGFIYRMLDEYEPEAAKTYPSENDSEFGNLHVKYFNELRRVRPAELYRAQAAEVSKKISQVRAELESTSDEALRTQINATLRTLVKESFHARTRLHKHELKLVRDERNTEDEKLKFARAEIQAVERAVEAAKKRIPELENAITSRKKYDDGLNELRARLEKEGKVMNFKQRTEIAKKLGFTLEEAESRTVESYEREITDKRTFIDASATTISDKTADADAQQTRVNELNAQMHELEERIDTLKSDYSAKFKSTPGTPGMTGTPAAKAAGKRVPGKLGKLAKHAKPMHALDAVEPEEYEPTDEDVDAINARVKSELGIERTREEHTEYMQDIIQDFLDQYFVYNPDTHVQCAYKPNYEDPLRTPLEMDQHRRVVEQEYERNLLPPDDTFYRWARYEENNYEALRQATDDIYCEKSDFEFDIVPLEVFEGPDAKEKAEEFNRKYSDEVEADILRATFGEHNLMGSWAQNREKRDFYNENSEIIKRILDENEESQKFGKKLNKQRAEKKKAENEKVAGPHAPSFQAFKNSNPNPLREHGAVEASEIATENIIPRDDGELGENEMEVGVSVIRPIRRRGGRRGYRGTTDQYKFHIPEEKLKPENVEVRLPSAVHKQLQKDEAKDT
jgi:hypothetical protein